MQSLPVPDLESTCKKLLELAKPLATEDELHLSLRNVEEFLSLEGPKLQQELEVLNQEAKSVNSNWLEGF